MFHRHYFGYTRLLAGTRSTATKAWRYGVIVAGYMLRGGTWFGRYNPLRQLWYQGGSVVVIQQRLALLHCYVERRGDENCCVTWRSLLFVAGGWSALEAVKVQGARPATGAIARLLLALRVATPVVGYRYGGTRAGCCCCQSMQYVWLRYAC